MKKLFIGSAVVFLMIFTAGLVTGLATVAPVFTGTGDLFVLDNLGNRITGLEGTWTIELYQGDATSMPKDLAKTLFYGTLYQVNTSNTLNFAAVLGEDGYYTFDSGSIFGKFKLEQKKNPTTKKQDLAAVIQGISAEENHVFVGELFK